MPTEVRLVRRVSIEDLGLPPPVFVRDAQNRVIQMRFTYDSIEVVVDATWVGASAEIATYTRLVQDVV